MRCGAALAAAVVACLASACMPGRSSTQPVDWTVRGASLTGDIDGDGHAEEVAVEESGPSSCRLRLRARGARKAMTTPIEVDSCEAKPPQNHPSVIALAAIDRHPGLEVVVEIGCGAHTCVATVFGAADRVLREWKVPFEALAYGGSVGTGARAVDCAVERGFIATEIIDFTTSSVHETRYRARDGRLERVRSRKKPAAEAQLSPRPFARCTVVSADR